MSDELPFKIVRANGHDELLALALNLPIARVRSVPRWGCTRRT